MLLRYDTPTMLPGGSGEMAAHPVFGPLRAADRENCLAAYLDADSNLLATRQVAGVVDWVEVPVRTIAADAVSLGAARVVLAHNHPSGDPRPSRGDLNYTRNLARGLATLGVELFDHLVIAGAAVTSLRDQGLL